MTDNEHKKLVESFNKRKKLIDSLSFMDHHVSTEEMNAAFDSLIKETVMTDKEEDKFQICSPKINHPILTRRHDGFYEIGDEYKKLLTAEQAKALALALCQLLLSSTKWID